jgi:hypothetical protein
MSLNTAGLAEVVSDMGGDMELLQRRLATIRENPEGSGAAVAAPVGTLARATILAMDEVAQQLGSCCVEMAADAVMAVTLASMETAVMFGVVFGIEYHRRGYTL